VLPDYIAAVLADSPAAFWEFQDAGDYPQDSSGNGKHMDTKAVVTTLSYRDPSFVGPQSSFFIREVTASLGRVADTVLTATDNITMELWLRSVSSGATLEVFFIGAATGMSHANSIGSNGWGLASNNANRPVIRVLNGGALTDKVSTASFNPTALWHHYVLARRSGAWELWIDGVQDASIGSFTAAPGAYAGAGQAVYIGQADPTPGEALTLNVAFPALYPVALSASRIAAHYDAMFTWNNAYVELDNSTDPVLPGTFTTTDGRQGLVPDRPYHFADYNELSWLTTGDTDIEYASGGGASLFP
jgi:hypothetical protein